MLSPAAVVTERADFRMDEAVQLRPCRRCSQLKLPAEFNRDPGARSGLRTQCRVCQSEYNARFRARKPLYNIWNLMMQRCYNRSNAAFRWYGARGIAVCDRWHRFEDFSMDMSPRPSPRHSLERVDNDGDYSPANCRWALPNEQLLNVRSNRRVVIGGVTKPLAELIRILNLSRCVVEARIYRYGWDVVAALITPTRGRRKGAA